MRAGSANGWKKSTVKAMGRGMDRNTTLQQIQALRKAPGHKDMPWCGTGVGVRGLGIRWETLCLAWGWRPSCWERAVKASGMEAWAGWLLPQ